MKQVRQTKFDQQSPQALCRCALFLTRKAGNAIERMATREDAVELLVQLKGGERRALVQAKGEQTLVPGDAVILVTTGGKVRITKAPK